MVHFVHYSAPSGTLSMGRLNLPFLPELAPFGTKRCSKGALLSPLLRQLITRPEGGPLAPTALSSWSKPAWPAEPALTSLVSRRHLWAL